MSRTTRLSIESACTKDRFLSKAYGRASVPPRTCNILKEMDIGVPNEMQITLLRSERYCMVTVTNALSKLIDTSTAISPASIFAAYNTLKISAARYHEYARK